MQEIKALVFDVFGTVVDWRTSIAKEAEAFFGQHGISGDGYKFADDWRNLYQPAMQACRSGERPYTRLDDLHRENLDKVLKAWDIQNVSEEKRQHLNHAWRRLQPWPDSVPGLHRLKSKFIIGTLSNGNIALMVGLAKWGGLPWDAILGADVSRAYKPEPASYIETAKVLALEPQEVALVAAHNDDLLAARDCGLRTMFVTRPTEHGPGQKIDLEPEADWDVCANSLEELADKLGC
ncbi:haloacid dehalogenase type II [Cupriavidus sp. AcVe19-6a]|uniref:haloacid dehalogenase type II n=1 Tax=Cupriavidus sp. AcVe19-6a TaxID=2821358 RepID=UPI001AE33762|nr:haloacid dehalogenase type II [Cupriavidus sp. AcVe19-6a]MBP0637970.1 haloacid dehalogenase type II [Cupriavidus sp. AcVe19-6a]